MLFVVSGLGSWADPPVPAKLLDILIFLGSFSSSVKNKKSSNIFIPVILVSSLKFKTLSAVNITFIAVVEPSWAGILSSKNILVEDSVVEPESLAKVCLTFDW